MNWESPCIAEPFVRIQSFNHRIIKSSHHHINVNGRLLPAGSPAISADSRAFRYGCGLFETMLVREGSIRLAALHWERLREGMAALAIHAPDVFFQTLGEAVQELLHANGHEALSRVRLQVWPSGGGYFDGGDFSAEYCIENVPLGEEIFGLNSRGLVIGIAEGITKFADSWSHLKSCSAQPYVLAARQARARGWDDALLCNQHGRFSDSSVANLFWLSRGKIFTPPLTEGCVAGVMRRHLLCILPMLGYEAEEAPAPPSVLHSADCIFLTNAIRGLRWVKDYAGRFLDAGMVVELHREVLRSF